MADEERPPVTLPLGYGVPPAPRGSRAARVVAGSLLLLFVLPAGFGFLATFEPGYWPVWKLVFPIAGMTCLLLGGWLILKK